MFERRHKNTDIVQKQIIYYFIVDWFYNSYSLLISLRSMVENRKMHLQS